MWQKTLIFANKRKYLRINAILFNSFLNQLRENEKNKVAKNTKKKEVVCGTKRLLYMRVRT